MRRPGLVGRPGLLGRPARAAVVAVAVLGVLTGCGAPAEPPPVPAPSSAPPSAAPAQTADQASCREFASTADTVRSIATVAQRQPILPAAVAIVLLGPRERASLEGIADPELAAAQTEFVAAIDDLDAQGRALLPPGGNPGQNAVQLDPARVVAAVVVLEELCGRV